MPRIAIKRNGFLSPPSPVYYISSSRATESLDRTKAKFSFSPGFLGATFPDFFSV